MILSGAPLSAVAVAAAAIASLEARRPSTKRVTVAMRDQRLRPEAR